ncbi:MAG: GTP-binding protein [Bacilli bacterium]
MSSNKSRMPIMLLSGFLGSGKTTLLSRLLQSEEMNNVMVIVNEFGEVGLDHHLIRRIDEDHDRTLLIGGGCICCSTRKDLVTCLNQLLNRIQKSDMVVDRVIIETTGLADPAPIMFTVLRDPVLQYHFYIEKVIVTVDAVNGSLHLKQPETVKQITVADKIIITKLDIAGIEVETALTEAINCLNPSAHILKAVYGEIDLSDLLSEQVLSMDKEIRHRDKSTGKMESHTSDTKSISISFDNPIDWNAFGLWLSMLLYARGEDVFRVKGLLDVGEQGPVSLNGVQHIIHPPDHLEKWPVQDRRSHLIFIVRNIDPAQIVSSLDAFQHILGAIPRSLELKTLT